jgi:hypothetical protein
MVNIMKNAIIFYFAIYWFATPAAAQEHNLIQKIENRIQQQFLLFSARSPALAPASPGHAFVSFGTTDTALNANINDTYGFYPCVGCSMMDDPKPGRVVRGFWKNRNNKPLHSLAVSADSHFNYRTQIVIEKWKGVRYNLIRRNCVKFISEVAAAQGMVTPKTTRFGFLPKFPKTYIRQLKQANPSRIITVKGLDANGLPYLLDENKNNLMDIDELELEASNH